MIDLLVPWALDPADLIVSVASAANGVAYRCPDCKSPLSLKDGKDRVRHFSHRAVGNCSYESVVHQTAKRLILHVVEEWCSGRGERPVMVRRCARGHWGPHRPISGRITTAVLEKALPSGIRPDVTLLAGEAALAAVEICQTHAVDDEKAARIGIPWWELAAGSVIENPLRWRAINSGGLVSVSCGKCADEAETLAAFHRKRDREDAEEAAYRARDRARVAACRLKVVEESKARLLRHREAAFVALGSGGTWVELEDGSFARVLYPDAGDEMPWTTATARRVCRPTPAGS